MVFCFREKWPGNLRNEVFNVNIHGWFPVLIFPTEIQDDPHEPIFSIEFPFLEIHSDVG
jgi:hypothetical protein